MCHSLAIDALLWWLKTGVYSLSKSLLNEGSEGRYMWDSGGPMYNNGRATAILLICRRKLSKITKYFIFYKVIIE